LATDLHNRPTCVEEIMADDPAGIGSVDASGHGMGRVWFIPGARLMVWRRKFDSSVQACLITAKHPKGTVNNSELELARIIARHDVLAQHVDVDRLTFATLGDNAASLV
jgi:hypothetical protein